MLKLHLLGRIRARWRHADSCQIERISYDATIFPNLLLSNAHLEETEYACALNIQWLTKQT